MWINEIKCDRKRDEKWKENGKKAKNDNKARKSGRNLPKMTKKNWQKPAQTRGPVTLYVRNHLWGANRKGRIWAPGRSLTHLFIEKRFYSLWSECEYAVLAQSMKLFNALGRNRCIFHLECTTLISFVFFFCTFWWRRLRFFSVPACRVDCSNFQCWLFIGHFAQLNYIKDTLYPGMT